MRGDGRIFRQPRSPYWYCAYYDAKGKEQREVCHNRKGEKLEATEANVDAANKYLRKLVDAVRAEALGAPAFLGPDTRRMPVNDMLDKLEAHYKLGGKRGIPREVGPQMRSHLKRLRDYFGDMRAVAIDESRVQEFISNLRSQGKQNATVNRSLQLLRQAYKVSGVPCAFAKLSLLDESDNVRKGKFTQAEVERLKVSLPGYLADVAEFAYITGARVGEILKLRWSYLKDRQEGDAIEVPASDTKNRKPRSIALDSEDEDMMDLIARRRKARVPGCDLIFHNAGHPIRDYRKAWHTACVLNGFGKFYCRDCRNEVLDAKRTCPKCGKKWEVPRYEGRIMHDFRRSAAFELWQGGSSYEECMKVTGHATTAMFRRYADIFTEDQERAIQRTVQQRRRQWQQEQIITSTMQENAAVN